MSLLASLLSTSVALRAATTICFPLPVAPAAEPAPAPAAAIDVSGAPTSTLATDPAVVRLVERALARRAELAATRARAAAERERAPQARALPDPVVGLAIQNDGFRELQIGKMPTSWVAMMAAQTFPWFGTRELRAGLTDIGARRVDADLRRVELTVRAEVERAVLDVIANRDELALLGRLELLWEQSEVVARARYRAARGPSGPAAGPAGTESPAPATHPARGGGASSRGRAGAGVGRGRGAW